MSGDQEGGATHDRSVEQALRESEHRLQLALAAGDLGAFDLDVTRGITFMSPRVYSIFGYETGDPRVPRNLEEFFGALHPEDAARVQQAVAAQLGADAAFDAEYRVRTASGAYVWVHCTARRFVVDGDVRVCGFIRDISEHKRSEEHQRQLEAQLRHAQEMETLGTLAGGIAHDFNNLLVPMLGNAEYVLRKAELSSTHRAALQDIVSAALRAKELVQRILVFGRRNQHEPSQRVRVGDVAIDALRLTAAQRTGAAARVAARIVCVDDEPAVLRTLELLMQHAGHSVTFFASALAALERLAADASQVDLVITDQTMPELTGLDLARRLHALRADLPVIMLSGHAEAEDTSASPPNIRLCLRKPVRSEQLLEAVSHVLAGGSR
jgi:PAS domain S-box-containing protein